MNDALWALLGDSVYMLAGLLIAIAFILSIFEILGGIFVDRRRAFSERALKKLAGYNE